MKYCIECGTKLVIKNLEHEGMIPYCSCCKEYRFPIFSTAVSMVIIDKKNNKALLIKQYNTNNYRLVAGYVSKGESAEDAVKREIKEEIGADVLFLKSQKTEYYEKSNTLMINYYVELKANVINPNYEIDSYAWIDIDECEEALKNASLALDFLRYYLKNNN